MICRQKNDNLNIIFLVYKIRPTALLTGETIVIVTHNNKKKHYSEEKNLMTFVLSPLLGTYYFTIFVILLY